MLMYVRLYFNTVAQKLNQGTIRIRAVIECGVLFGYFLDKQKVTKKTLAPAQAEKYLKRLKRKLTHSSK